MTKKKFIDKKKSLTFHLVHRSQRDPLIYDEQASLRVLIPRISNREKETSIEEEISDKISYKKDLNKLEKNRENIGESILYGISYDDSEYDYMQHLREIGKTPDTILLRASTHQNLNIIHELPKDVFPSEIEQIRTYQDQQSLPDNISGFQPDMDPELREVLLALDDDRYLSSDEDGDLDALIKSGKVNDSDVIQNPDDETWDSDNTIKTFKEVHNTENSICEENGNSISQELLQYKKKKFRKPLSTTTYASMSSSILPRTQELVLLDDRFEKIEKEYNNNKTRESDEENISQRIDFESVMDDFLNNYEIIGKKMMLKLSSKQYDTKHYRAIAELDEIRQQLGKAKI